MHFYLYDFYDKLHAVADKPFLEILVTDDTDFI